eukprot:304841-Pyramimonas_sp.AAC.1
MPARFLPRSQPLRGDGARSAQCATTHPRSAAARRRSSQPALPPQTRGRGAETPPARQTQAPRHGAPTPTCGSRKVARTQRPGALSARVARRGADASPG